jgi:hypothetical protein
MKKWLAIGLGVYIPLFLFNRFTYAAQPEIIGGWGNWGELISDQDKRDYFMWENGMQWPTNSVSPVTQDIATLAVIAAIDYKQSADMFYNPPVGKRYIEMNPILGPNPTKAGLVGFGVAGIGLLYIAEELLPDNWKKAKQILADSVLSTEMFNVQENARLQNPDLQHRDFNTIPIIITIRW